MIIPRINFKYPLNLKKVSLLLASIIPLLLLLSLLENQFGILYCIIKTVLLRFALCNGRETSEKQQQQGKHIKVPTNKQQFELEIKF